MIIGRSSTNFLFFVPIGNPRWLPPQVIVLTQDHMGKMQKYGKNNQKLSRACIVHLVIKRTNWSYVKTMSYSGSHLGITINIKNTKFYADRKSKMTATTGHSINTGPYGENTEIYSSLKLLH
jgi:hypothetical protein